MRDKRWHILVCGRKSNRDGSIHVEHKDLVAKALVTYCSLAKDANFDEGRKVVIILLGGVSRGTKSEALLAHEYLVEIAREQGVALPEVLLEERSRSSEENIKFAKAVSLNKGYVASRLYLVARESQCPKIYSMALAFWKQKEENILQVDRIITVPGLDVALPKLYRWLDFSFGPFIWNMKL